MKKEKRETEEKLERQEPPDLWYWVLFLKRFKCSQGNLTISEELINGDLFHITG